MSGFEQVESLPCDEVPEADKDGLARLPVDLNVSQCHFLTSIEVEQARHCYNE